MDEPAQDGEAERRPPMVRRWALSLLVAGLVFGFALPRLADYGDAWRTVTAMSRPEIALVALAGLWNLATYWPVIVLSLPGLRVSEAAVVNQASTAVANTVPAGGAVALGVTFRMLRAWGFTTPAITNSVLATGVWNNLAKFTVPVLGVAALVVTGELRASSLTLALTGLGALSVIALIGARALAKEESARRLGGWIDRFAARLRRRVGRPRHTDVAGWLVTTRRQMIDLLRRRGAPMTVATIVSHLSLYFVLLAALRGVGVGEDEASWAKVLSAFAFVRLLSALPVTPGGFGVVELGYVAYLTAGAAELRTEVTAAVLLFRAVTFVFPIPLGALAWLAFAARGSWRRPPDSRGDPVDGADDRDGDGDDDRGGHGDGNDRPAPAVETVS